MKPTATPTLQMGTWYFDRWIRAYVLVVAGAQREDQITVFMPRDNAVVTIARKDLDRTRSVTPDLTRSVTGDPITVL